MKGCYLPKTNKNIFVPSIRHVYQGRIHRRAAYKIKYSSRLFSTHSNYSNSEACVPHPYRISTISEEFEIMHNLIKAGIDPRLSEEYRDLVVFRNEGQWSARLWTKNGLRVPKGWEDGRKDRNGTYPRMVLDGYKPVGIVHIPNSSGVIPTGNLRDVIDFLYGTPRIMSNKKDDFLLENHFLHFELNPNPPRDPKSGYQDVRIFIYLGSLFGGRHRHCMCIDAVHYDVENAYNFGVRLVEGLLPSIKLKSVKSVTTTK